MSNISTLWGREPAMVVALVQAALVLGVSFGLDISAEQIAAILALSAIVLGLITRSQVTAPANLPAAIAAADAVNPPYIPGEQNG